MAIDVGDLDTWIVFQVRQEAQETVYGTDSGSAWANLAQEAGCWAEVMEMLPSRGERLAEGLNITRRPARIRLHWRGDITAAMRILLPDDNNRILQIVGGPVEMGRKEYLELVAEQLSTEEPVA